MAKGNRGGKRASIFGGQQTQQGGKIISDLPAKMNRLYNGNNMSESHTIDTFRNEHANSNTEHLIAYDDDGFVSVYNHGGAHSVGFDPATTKGKNIIHNHPSGSHFSAQDLDNVTRGYSKSVIATTRNGNVWKFEATAKADGAGFRKALQNAKSYSDINTMDGYNKAVHTFLRNNASKYGFKYTSEKR